MTFPAIARTISPSDETNYLWRSANEALTGNNAVLYTSIKPSDINQGNLADCYLLSALCVLTIHRQHIAQLFHESNDNNIKMNSVWLNDSGEWRLFCMDNQFPCIDKKSGPAFARPGGNELWVMLIEKAYAKLFGSYKAIEYGYSTHALRDLTGAPYEVYACTDADQTWDFLESVLIDKNWIVTANTRVKQNRLEACYTLEAEEEDEHHGQEEKPTVSQHCYAVMGIKQVASTGKRTERMVQLNDPWQSNVALTKWASKMVKWPFELQQQLGINTQSQTLWLPVEQFVEYFSTGGCCKIYEKYVYTHLKLRHERGETESMILLEVEQDCHLFFGLSQRDEKHFHFEKSDCQYKYSTVRMIIAKINKRQELTEAVGGVYESNRDVFVEANLTSGLYMVYIEIEWRQSLVRQFVFNTYGSARPIATEAVLEGNKDQVVHQMMTKAAAREVSKVDEREDPHGLETAENLDFTDYQHLGEKNITRNISNIHGYLVFYYKNQSQSKGLREKVAMLALSNLQIIGQHNNNNEFEVELTPGEEKVVLYKPIEEGPFKYEYKNWSQLFTYFKDPKMMRNYVISNARKVNQKKLHSREMSVWVYTCPEPSRVYFLWVNDSEYAFEEKITFNKKNLVSDTGDERDVFDVNLRPNSEHLLTLKAKDLSHGIGFSYSVNYKFRKYIPKRKAEEQSQAISSYKKPISSPMNNEYSDPQTEFSSYPYYPTALLSGAESTEEQNSTHENGEQFY